MPATRPTIGPPPEARGIYDFIGIPASNQRWATEVQLRFDLACENQIAPRIFIGFAGPGLDAPDRTLHVEDARRDHVLRVERRATEFAVVADGVVVARTQQPTMHHRLWVGPECARGVPPSEPAIATIEHIAYEVERLAPLRCTRKSASTFWTCGPDPAAPSALQLASHRLDVVIDSTITAAAGPATITTLDSGLTRVTVELATKSFPMRGSSFLGFYSDLAITGDFTIDDNPD